MAGKHGWPVQLAMVPWVNDVAGGDLDIELTLLAVPDGVNMSIELLSVGVCAHTGGTTLLADLEWVDDSASDVVALLATAVDIDDITDRIWNEIWTGTQRLDPGDTVNLALTGFDTGSSVGYTFIVEFRIVERSGN